ncbi:hypothetical protein [Bacteroides sp.]|uniref:hypothetical protein n=1 Tax=Bacteroides sp. TaxID=29523 RepID=UPI0026141270|nr:hypothetical protein [Bacteroides sp.]MDD3039035.1 hypothetical protein [Bacteroides sp.]
MILDCNDVDQHIILFCAFRYALGRQTYVVSTIADAVVQSWYTMVPGQRRMFQKEVREAIDRDGAGSPMDVACWRQILEEEIE